MKKNDKFLEDLIESVKQDFLTRQQERKPFEAEWKLNNNFFHGNQYATINPFNDVEDMDKMYFWQEREVFNHIAPVIENRLSKLTATRPDMDIMPTTDSEDDRKIASLSKDILKNTYEKLNLSSVISKVTHWSEICGTGFYKVIWDASSGKVVYDKDGKKMREGDVSVIAVSPFEIFPDSCANENIEDCESIIHAKSYSVREIKNTWGVDVVGEDVDEPYMAGDFTSVKHNQALVIEKYEAPSVEYPEGRLIIVCGDKLLYMGELPFINLPDGKRGFPFIKQVALKRTGAFFGQSVISKLIPIQRAYNAVKNRKHEFINRLTMGVLSVEEGSVDIDDLSSDGLQPGKIIEYRQGATPPKFLTEAGMPDIFHEEEEQLLDEFSEISGVTELLSNRYYSKNLSGTAIELLIEQGENKLNITLDEIRTAVKQVAKQILRLYKQFAVMPRLVKLSDNKSVAYFKNSDLGLDDVQFVSDSILNSSLNSQRTQLLELINSGALKRSDGSIDEEVKSKILSLFGLQLDEDKK